MMVIQCARLGRNCEKRWYTKIWIIRHFICRHLLTYNSFGINFINFLAQFVTCIHTDTKELCVSVTKWNYVARHRTSAESYQVLSRKKIESRLRVELLKPYNECIVWIRIVRMYRFFIKWESLPAPCKEIMRRCWQKNWGAYFTSKPMTIYLQCTMALSCKSCS